MNYITPVGFRDVMSDEALVREDLTARVRACFAQKGYRPVETPTLEVLDVMEAGGHVPEAPFKFFDSHGDLLAMRPDVTMQIARMCATRGVAKNQPLRLRYTQRVFREKTAEAAARELTQCGAECIGAAGSEADVELVSLLASALSECGLETFTIALGSAGVLRDLLDASGASDQWKTAVMQAYHTSNFVYLEELVAAAERAANGGSSEAEDKARFKLADPAIANDLKYVLATANTLAAGRYQVAYCPSLVRGQGYYTGMVFEVTCPQFSGAVAGGGRYDNMVGKFLGVQVPAVGFSIGFERVCGILLEQGYQIPGAKQKIALLYGKGTDFPAVLSKAAALREQYNVTVLPQGKKLGKQLGQLEAAGFAGAAFMDKDEVKIFAQQ